MRMELRTFASAKVLRNVAQELKIFPGFVPRKDCTELTLGDPGWDILLLVILYLPSFCTSGKHTAVRRQHQG